MEFYIRVLREQVNKFFETMDRDFDGRLTLEEFMGEETPIEKLFKLMDKNGDGFVTRKVTQEIIKVNHHKFFLLLRSFKASARS